MAPLKVRSRRDGAAIPLDEADKKLLNLMQGSFALTTRPFAHTRSSRRDRSASSRSRTCVKPSPLLLRSIQPSRPFGIAAETTPSQFPRVRTTGTASGEP